MASVDISIEFDDDDIGPADEAVSGTIDFHDPAGECVIVGCSLTITYYVDEAEARVLVTSNPASIPDWLAEKATEMAQEEWAEQYPSTPWADAGVSQWGGE